MHLVAISYISVLIPRESFSAFLLKLADSSPWHIVIILTLFKLQAASWHDNNSKASLASSGYAVCHVTRGANLVQEVLSQSDICRSKMGGAVQQEVALIHSP